MARFLGPMSYGIFASFIATLAILSAPSSALSPLVTKQAAYLNLNGNFKAIIKLYTNYLAIFILTLISFQLILFFYGERIFTLLDIEPTLLFWVGIAAFSLIMIAVTSGVFYGTQRYRIAAYTSIIFSILKIVICFFLVLIGLGAFGAGLGIAIAALLTFFFASYKIFWLSRVKSSSNMGLERLGSKNVFMILSANTFFSVMIHSDVIIVNYFFSSSESGVYAATATIARSILYLPGGLAIALLSTTSNQQHKNGGDHKDLNNILALTGISCLVVAFFMSVFSELIINLAFGDGYDAASDLLGWYALIMIPWSLVMVLENYLIAHGKYFLTWVYFAGIIIGFFLVLSFHKHPMSILYIVGILGITISMIGFIYAWIKFGSLLK